MPNNEHPMGLPVEPTQWFITFIKENGERCKTVQVQANGAADAASIAWFEAREIAECRDSYTAVLVRSRHKKLPLLNSRET